MKTKKRNYLEDKADKIEEIPEEVKNDEDKFQEKPTAARKPKNNRFLACLRRAWMRFIGCMRCCTSIQVEESYHEVQQPSKINMVEELSELSAIDIEKEFQEPSGLHMEEELAKLTVINMDEELPEPSDTDIEEFREPSGFKMEDSKGKTSCNIFYRLHKVMVIVTVINMGEEFPEPSDTDMKEELPEPSDTVMEEFREPRGINMVEGLLELSAINIEEEFQKPSGIHIEEELPEPTVLNMEEELSKPSDTDIEEFWEPSGIKMEDSKDDSSKGKEEEDNGESDIVIITEEREDRRSEEPSSNSSSLEETQLDQNSSSDDMSDFYSVQEEILEALSKSSKTSQSSSGDTSDSLDSVFQEIIDTIIKLFKPAQRVRSDDTSDSCSLEEEILEVLSKSSKTSQSSSGDNSDSLDSVFQEIIDTIIKLFKPPQRVRRDDTSDCFSLEEEIPEELSKSGNNSHSSSLCDKEPNTSDVYLEEPNQSAKETSSTVPLTLDSFCFYKKLGQGCYGKVLLAKDTIRKEYIAIKVSHKENFLRGNSFAERNVLQLSHESPYLIHGLGAFHTQNLVCYVMELATRGNLRDFIHKNFPLDTATIKFIITEVICGIQFLHKNGIIHRDLTPANILLTEEGHIKISDFGSAITGVNDTTRERGIGTPGYAALEQLLGREHGYGVDYFDIGVILYRLYNFKAPLINDEGVIIHNARYPKALTNDTVDILKGLLENNPLKRLGVNGDIKNHQYFKDINWEDVEARKVTPPAIMTATSVNLDVNSTVPFAESTLNSINAIHQKMFNKFSFVCAEWSQHYHHRD